MKFFDMQDIFNVHDFKIMKRPHLIISGILSAGILLAYSLLRNENILSISTLIHIISAAFIFIIAYLIYKKCFIISTYLLSVVYLVNLLIIFGENIENQEMATFFPVTAFIFFYILGYQKGLFMTITFSTFLIMVYFFEIERSSVISDQTIINAMLSYFIIGLISGIHSRHLENQEKILLSRSNYDYLTGIFNRRAFLNHLLREFDFIKRNQDNPLSLLMLDLDNLDSINNNFSHEAGDNVLISFKNIILENLRITDIFARWSGAEFIIAAIDTSIDNAKLLADKIHKLVEDHTFETGSKITVSIGISCYKPGDHIDSLIKKANAALIAAKNNGKNKVIIEN